MQLEIEIKQKTTGLKVLQRKSDKLMSMKAGKIKRK